MSLQDQSGHSISYPSFQPVKKPRKIRKQKVSRVSSCRSLLSGISTIQKNDLKYAQRDFPLQFDRQRQQKETEKVNLRIKKLEANLVRIDKAIKELNQEYGDSQKLLGEWVNRKNRIERLTQIQIFKIAPDPKLCNSKCIMQAGYCPDCKSKLINKKLLKFLKICKKCDQNLKSKQAFYCKSCKNYLCQPCKIQASLCKCGKSV